MGEMADYYVERMIWRTPRRGRDNIATCKFCKEDIQWGLKQGQWKAMNSDGTLHDCRNTIDEFERN